MSCHIYRQRASARIYTSPWQPIHSLYFYLVVANDYEWCQFRQLAENLLDDTNSESLLQKNVRLGHVVVMATANMADRRAKSPEGGGGGGGLHESHRLHFPIDTGCTASLSR